MAVQAGVVSAGQVSSASSTVTPSSAPGYQQPSTWAWAWFFASLLFLVFTFLARGKKGV
jgi:hypothetical protein